MGNEAHTETRQNIIKRNGFVPMITSSLDIDKVRMNTLEEMCLKYANINISENCPVCLCDEAGLEEECSFGCQDECQKEFRGNELPQENIRKKIPSLGFDQMENKAEEGDISNKSHSKKKIKKKKLKIVRQLDPEELLSIMDDELPYGEDSLFICDKVDPAHEGPNKFQIFVNSTEFSNHSNSSLYKTDKLKSF